MKRTSSRFENSIVYQTFYQIAATSVLEQQEFRPLEHNLFQILLSSLVLMSILSFFAHKAQRPLVKLQFNIRWQIYFSSLLHKTQKFKSAQPFFCNAGHVRMAFLWTNQRNTLILGGHLIFRAQYMSLEHVDKLFSIIVLSLTWRSLPQQI